MKTALDWFDSEPTTSELAAIEAEWPIIAAELTLLDRLVEYDITVTFDDLDVFSVATSAGERPRVRVRDLDHWNGAVAMASGAVEAA